MAFRGNHQTKVDDKGRLKLPADFKRYAEEKYGIRFFITSIEGDYAQIYPLQEWEAIEKKFEKEMFEPVVEQYMSKANYYGQMVEMDNQGRLLLPQELREEANLLGDVSVIGQTTFLKVIESTKAKADVKAARLTNEDFKALQSILKQNNP